ncbi:regulator of Ty1 Transposition [Lecanora helva]
MAAMDVDGGAEGKALFAQVRFYIVLTADLGVDIAEAIGKLLEQNGGREIPRVSSGSRIPIEEITHIISTTIDFPDYQAATDALKSVVKPEWVEASVSKARLSNPRQYNPDPRMFFSGLVVCCADLPSGDADAIIGGSLAMGGLYSSPVTKQVTHIVALTTDAEKCQVALEKNLKCKIVLPHWFDDCLKLGKRIDERPYCLPDPEILRKRPEDRIPEATRLDLLGATTPNPDHLPTPSSSPGAPNAPSAHRRKLAVFKNKKVMLSNDLGLSSRLLETIEDLIVSSGGSVTGSVHRADLFICQFRDSLEYRVASRAGKDVGNLAWLYHLITHNEWTSPLRRLLHYPIASQGLPGFNRFRISLSNYNGEARIYLENLAKAAGGEFTKTMKEDNTHLITAHMASEKCDAAKEWNIHMVNHLWLEESYAKWSIQTVSNSRYTHFPQRTNLGEVVGQTPIDRQAVERTFFPLGSDIDVSAESVTSPKPMSVRDNNAAPPKKLKASSARPRNSSKAQEMPFRSSQSDEPTPKASKENRRHTDGPLRTPAPPRYMAEGKENVTPSTTGSRGAKDKAVARLHNLVPDIALFEKEKKRVGGVTHGRDRRSSEDKASEASRKRSASAEESDSGAEEAKIAKKAKKSKGLAAPVMRLAHTGYKRWYGAANKEGEERTRLREMGILVVNDYTTCTHLASPKIVRTEKFICALAHSPVIISTNFIEDCLSGNCRQDPRNYLLKDSDYEKSTGIKLSDALVRAKKNKGQLLRGYSIYVTEAVHGGFDTYKSIVEVNGGRCLLYRARAGSIRAGLDEDTDGSESNQPQYIYLVSGTTHEEAKLWPKFRQMVAAVGKEPRIVRNDWVLHTALSQQHHWKDYYALNDGDAGTPAP